MIVILAAALYLFGNGPGPLAALIAAVLIPFVFIVLSRPLAAHLCAGLTLPSACEKGRPVSGVLFVENRGILPAGNAGCRIVCRNLLTGETRELTLCFGVSGRSRTEVGFEFTSDHCGELSVSAERLFVCDAFGLTAASAAYSQEKRVLVRPDIFDMELSLVDGASAMPDSDRYSMTKPGRDPGETFGIREYVPGDPVKSIHWKLSQKSDRLMAREFGLPVIDQVLLLLETFFPPEAGVVGADEIDALAETFLTVSNALLELGTEHAVGWQDTDSGAFETYEVSSKDDLYAAAERVLSNPVRPGDRTAAGCFLSEYEKCGYTHVAVVAPYVGPDVSGLYNGNRVTVLLSSSDRGNDGMQADGVNVVTFDSGSRARDLCRLEL